MFVLLDEAIEELADVVDHFSGWDSLLPSRYVLLIALADAGFRAISFDYKGYGLSDVPPTKATFSDVLNDLLAVIDSLGLPKVFLVGKDFGARPAHFFSVLYPERVLGVVTLGVPYAHLPSWFTEEDLATYGALYEKSGFQPALQIPYRSFDEVFNLPREVSEVIAKRGTVCDFWQLFKALISSKARYGYLQIDLEKGLAQVLAALRSCFMKGRDDPCHLKECLISTIDEIFTLNLGPFSATITKKVTR
ncbi:hypothetical protein Fmac_032717 [Flemingia macrophylla]|uniref:AB hydrolase-1 domain-containing protein n=1 Tax=Flemingia macrophylla TaxID=520843 RepID=A0ABD1L5R9_9FABA